MSVTPWISTRPLIVTLCTPSDVVGNEKLTSWLSITVTPVAFWPSIVKSLGLTDDSRMLSLTATVMLETWKLISEPAAGLVEVTVKAFRPPGRALDGDRVLAQAVLGRAQDLDAIAARGECRPVDDVVAAVGRVARGRGDQVAASS